MLDDFNFNFSFDLALEDAFKGTSGQGEGNVLTLEDIFGMAAKNLPGGKEILNKPLSQWKGGVSDALDYSSFAGMVTQIFGSTPTPQGWLPITQFTSQGDPLQVNALTLPSESDLVDEYGETMGTALYNKCLVFQDYVGSLNSFLQSNPKVAEGLTSDEMNSLLLDAEQMIMGQTPTNPGPAFEMLNSIIMAKVAGDVGSNPSNFGLSATAGQNFLNSLSTMDGSKLSEDTQWQNFLSTVTAYVSTNAAQLGTTLGDFIDLFYNDSMAASITQDSEEMNYIDPSYATVAPPNYSLIDQSLGIDLNSAANQQLYQSLLASYAEENDLTPEQLQRLADVHENPAIDDPWAQKANLLIMAQLLGTLVEQGEIQITETLYESIVSQLPPQVQKEIQSMEAEAGTLEVGGLTATQLTAILGAILVSGEIEVNEADAAVAKIQNANNVAKTNGVIYLGAQAALQNVNNPNKYSILNFLGTTAQFTLQFKNELIEVMYKDSLINQVQNQVKLSVVDEQLNNIELEIAAQYQQEVKQAQELQALKNQGFDEMMGAAAMIVLAVILFMCGMGALGALLIMAAAGLMVSGALSYLQGEGINVLSMIDQFFGNNHAEIIGITILASILTIMFAPLLGPLAAILIGAIIGFATDVLSNEVQTLVYQDYIAKGYSEQDAQKMATIITMCIIGGATLLTCIDPENVEMFFESLPNLATRIAETVANLSLEMVGNILQNIGRFVVNILVAVPREMIEDVVAVFKSLGKIISAIARRDAATLIKMAQSFRAAVEDPQVAFQVSQSIAQAIQGTIEGYSQIVQAQCLQAEGQIEAQLAGLEANAAMLSSESKLMDMETQQISNSNSDIENMINELVEDFQEAIQSLSQAVTALTSNQASPQASPTGGGIPTPAKGAANPTTGMANPTEEKSTVSSSKKSTADDMSIAAASLMGASMMASAAIVASGEEEEGYQAIGSKNKKSALAISTLMRAVSGKISQMMKSGALPKNTNPMQAAANMLKQAAMLKNGEPDLSEEGKEALSKNSILTTMMILLNQAGLGDALDLSELMGADPNNPLFTKATITKLAEMVEKLAETDPSFAELAALLKKLGKKSSLSYEDNFEILKAFDKALQKYSASKGQGNGSPLEEFIEEAGGGSAFTGNCGIDPDLIDEYFIQGSKGFHHPVHTHV